MAGENKQIYQLTSRTFDGDSIIPFDRPNTDPSTMAEKPYLSGNCNGHDVTDFVANTEEYTTDLDTTAKTITGAINELNGSIGVDAYDDTATYAVGDLCIYNNTLYKCTTAITVAEAWNASHWTATSIATEIGAINTALTPLTKEKTQTVYCSNGARIWIKRLGTTVQVEINESSQMTFLTSWANVYTDSTYQTRAYLDSELVGLATTLYVPIGLVNGHQIILKIERSNRAIQIICDVNTAIYPQGSGVYSLA